MRIGNSAHFICLAFSALAVGGSTEHAHGTEQKPAHAISRDVREPLFDETVTPVFQRAIPNIPGRNMVALVVTYPPGGKSPAHRHAPSAFIYAYVLSGAIRSQVDDEPANVYSAGESFFETPGARHRVCENASATESASMLAMLIVDPHEKLLTIPERE